MSKLRLWFKRKLCTHYHETTALGVPLFDVFPRKTVYGTQYSDGYKKANNGGLIHPEAVQCMNCGLWYFDTGVEGLPL